MLKFLVRILLLLLPAISFAQDNLLVSFTGQQVSDYVHISFTVKGGVSCLGTEVQRSSDSIHFEALGIIPAVCGSSTSEEAYTFDDIMPLKNKANYYRIHFGQLGPSQIIRIQVVDYGNGIFISPVPAWDVLNFYFSNSGNQRMTLELLDLHGAVCRMGTTYGHAASWNRDLLPSGIYIIKLSNEKQILATSKIVLQ